MKPTLHTAPCTRLRHQDVQSEARACSQGTLAPQADLTQGVGWTMTNLTGDNAPKTENNSSRATNKLKQNFLVKYVVAAILETQQILKLVKRKKGRGAFSQTEFSSGSDNSVFHLHVLGGHAERALYPVQHADPSSPHQRSLLRTTCPVQPQCPPEMKRA